MPLASDIFGEPGRFKLAVDFTLASSEDVLRPKGVFVPFDDVPEANLSPSLAFPLSPELFFSSSFFSSSSFRLSSSEVSPSL